MESDGNVSALCLAQGSQNLKVDSFASFASPGEIQIDGQKENPKYKHYPSYHENKNTFTSTVSLMLCRCICLFVYFFLLSYVDHCCFVIAFSALLVGSPSSSMTGIQLSSLDAFDIKYVEDYYCSLIYDKDNINVKFVYDAMCFV